MLQDLSPAGALRVRPDLQGDNVLVSEGTHDGNFALEVLHRVAAPAAALSISRAFGSVSFQLHLLHNLQIGSYTTPRGNSCLHC